jgi:predicted Zn finger-like uncharacterized protein
MDVRCERCRAQYVFDDEQVTPAGLTVQCTNCGHVFRVKKKELVVTVAVKPGEMDADPIPATAAAPRAPGALEPDHQREWRVRQASGNVFTFKELTTLQKWIVEQKVSRDDQISMSGDQWKRLGDIAELSAFFHVVEQAKRAKAPPTVTAVPMGAVFPVAFPPAAGYPPPPPSGFPPPAFAIPPPAPGGAQPGVSRLPVPPQGHPITNPEPGIRSAASEPTQDVELAREELAAVTGGAKRARALAVLLLLVALGAGAYFFGPELYRRTRPAPAAKPPETAAVPPTIELKPSPPADAAAAPPPATSAAAPVAAPEPVAEPALPKAPEPVARPEPKAPPAPRGTKALLAQAQRVRERGEAAKALELYRRVVDAEPENAEALAGRGLCYLDLLQYPPAEASFSAALQSDPEQPDALLGLAETYRWQGKKAQAITYYQRYLASHPDGEEAAVARNAISQLRE